jgi:hypothetical protein
MKAAKTDFRAEQPELYRPSSKAFALVDVPEMPFLMIDGRGDPATSTAYHQAIEALYSVAYTLKFLGKGEGRDFAVPPLEGLWDSPAVRKALTSVSEEKAWIQAFKAADRGAWEWTAMIRQPAWVTSGMVREAKKSAEAKKNLPGLDHLRLESYREGLSVQILHVGPYADEAPTLARLHTRYLPETGLKEAGRHHEIYLGDPRRTAPDRLKTILRQPVRRVR